MRSDWRNYLDTSNLAFPTPPGLPTFSEVAGDWSVQAGKLIAPSTGDALLISGRSAASRYMNVQAQCGGQGALAKFRLVAAYQNPQNYLYAEAHFGTTPSQIGALRIGRVSGGTTTILGEHLNIPGNWFWFDPHVWLRFCIRPNNTAFASVEINYPQVGANIEEPWTPSLLVDLPSPPAGNGWGFGTGPPGSTTVWGPREFNCYNQNSDCPDCVQCFACENPPGSSPYVPSRVFVQIGGSPSAGNCGATNCGALIGNYVLPRADTYGNPYWSQRGVCVWRYTFPTAIPIGGTCGSAKAIIVCHGNIPFTTNHPIWGTACAIGKSVSGVAQTFSQVHLDGRHAAWAQILSTQPGQADDPPIDCMRENLTLPVFSLYGASGGCGTGLTCTILGVAG